jgi:PAS domain S-box-containing protein
MSCPFKQNKRSPKNENVAKFHKLVTFMQASPDAAFLLDKEGKIIYRNKAAELLFLTNVGSMSFCSLFTFSNQSVDCWDELAKSLSTTTPSDHSVTVQLDDNTSLDFLAYFVKLPRGMVLHLDGIEDDPFACVYIIPAPDVSEHGKSYESELINKLTEGADDHHHKHMRDVVEASLDPMFSVFESGVIWMANDAAIQLFGYSNSELSGRNISEICEGAREEQKSLHDMNDTSHKHLSVTAINRYGMDIPVDLSIRLMTSFDCTEEKVYFIHMKDCSILVEQQAQIKHKDDLCKAMINASFDPMFGIDQRGVIIVVNQAALSMFGYSEAEFIGHNISMICNEHDAKNHDIHIAKYVKTGVKRVVGRKRPLVARRKDGTNFHIELGVSEVNLSNGEKMFCGFVRDTTQQRLDREKLRRQEAVIGEQFFDLSPEDSNNTIKRYPARYTAA